MRLIHALLLLLCSTAVGSCSSNPLFSFLHGERFDLRTVNGQALPSAPWPAYPQIVEGWIRIVDDTLAERYEKKTAVISSTGFADWNRAGRYAIRGDTLVINYVGSGCPSCGPGPEYPADTFTVSGAGLLRRELFPPDSIVRYYAR